jgi:hypothetical protein
MGGATSTAGKFLMQRNLSDAESNQNLVSGTILSNVLNNQLRSRFSQDTIEKLISSAFALETLHLTDEEKGLVSEGYMEGLHAVFISFTIFIAFHFCACMFIRDYGIKPRAFLPSQQQP